VDGVWGLILLDNHWKSQLLAAECGHKREPPKLQDDDHRPVLEGSRIEQGLPSKTSHGAHTFHERDWVLVGGQVAHIRRASKVLALRGRTEDAQGRREGPTILS
jgi:hypothetical protein